MFKEKVIIITGSTSGIGLGIAEVFAQEKAKILINGFGEKSDIDAAIAKLKSLGASDVAYNAADLSKAADCFGLIEDAASRWKRVDVLVNNAGIQHVSPIEDFAPEKWEKVLSINLSSNFYTIQKALPLMRAQKWGRIINIASAHGLVASAHKSAYVAAKHGVMGLTKTVGLETAGSGITCNAICPGWVLTPLVEKQIAERATQKNMSIETAKADLLAEKQPSGEFATPPQIGGLALFLCTPAANQITGTSVSIDGGWTAR